MEIGGIPKVSTRFSLSMEMSRLMRDGTAKPVSRCQILRRKRGQGNSHLPCSADHEQDWQLYPVDLYPFYMYVTTIYTYTFSVLSLKLKIYTPTNYRSCSWSQRGTKVNGSRPGEDPLLKPRGIQVAIKFLPGPTNREHRKLIGIKTMSLGANYIFYCLERCQYFRI